MFGTTPWPKLVAQLITALFARALTGLNVKDLISNIGSASAAGGGATAAAAAPAAGAAAVETKEEKAEEESEGSDDDMGFGLFD